MLDSKRHQKIIEESPSPVVTEGERQMIFDYTLRLASAMGITEREPWNSCARNMGFTTSWK